LLEISEFSFEFLRW